MHLQVLPPHLNSYPLQSSKAFLLPCFCPSLIGLMNLLHTFLRHLAMKRPSRLVQKVLLKPGEVKGKQLVKRQEKQLAWQDSAEGRLISGKPSAAKGCTRQHCKLCALKYHELSLECTAQMLLRSPASRRASSRSRGKRSDRKLLMIGTRNWLISSERSCSKYCIAAAPCALSRMVSCLTRLPTAVYYR